MACPEKPAICHGASFGSLAELQESVRRFEKQTHAVFSMTKANKLTTFMAYSPSHHMSKMVRAQPDVIQSLVYYSVTYQCKHGGFHSASTGGKGLRRCKTLKIGCKAYFAVQLHPDMRLCVTRCNLAHNGHDLSEASFSRLAINRRLPEEAHPEILHMLASGVSKKIIRSRMGAKYNKWVTRDDLNNLLRKLKPKNRKSEMLPWTNVSDDEPWMGGDEWDGCPGDEDVVCEMVVKEGDGTEVNAGLLKRKHIPKGERFYFARLNLGRLMAKHRLKSVYLLR